MLALFALVAALGAFVSLAWLWLSASWKVVEDDEMADRLGESHGFGAWFKRKTRLLTYRRDERGRFRRHRR